MTAYGEAATWALDRRLAEIRSARRAWIVATIAATVAGLEALALAGLAPLKSVVPATVLVDRTTGFAQTVNEGQAITPDAALTQALLAQYVVARETLDRARLPGDYRKVALWSDGPVRRDYIAAAQGMAAHPPEGTSTTTIESVSLEAPGRARVRFVTTRRMGDGPVSRNWWVAQIGYRFSGAPLAMADRLDNPLGLAVTRYVRDQEAPPVTQDAP